MRNLLSRMGLCLVGLTLPFASTAIGAPPDEGYVGAIVYQNGTEPDRIACDTLDLVKTIYAAGKKTIFAIHPKYKELAQSKGANGDPQCTVGAYREVRVAGRADLPGARREPGRRCGAVLLGSSCRQQPQGRQHRLLDPLPRHQDRPAMAAGGHRDLSGARLIRRRARQAVAGRVPPIDARAEACPRRLDIGVEVRLLIQLIV